MIVCLGTTPAVQRVMVFDRLTPNEANHASATLQCAAGKAVNVARVLSQLGESALAMGFVGGPTGHFIRGDLDRTGVAHDFMTVDPPTRVCVTVIDQQAATATELVENPPPLPASAWDELDRGLGTRLSSAACLVLSGSLPPAAPEDFYARCTAAAHAAGVPVVLDARGRPLLRALESSPLVIKMNRPELAMSVGFDVDSDEATLEGVRRLLKDTGVRWAVVTLGSAGAVASNGRSAWRVTVPVIRPVSATGSGDAFSAGLAYGIARGEPVAQTLVLAAACGASNAMNTLPGQVRREEIDQFSSGIRIEPLDADRAVMELSQAWR
jgi:tagatose 6-phosphate kinase